MQVQFTDDEVVEAFNAIVNQMADNAGLSDRDRATLKRWKSKMRLGSDDMNEFVRKANEDFRQQLARRERSQLRKPDWAD